MSDTVQYTCVICGHVHDEAVEGAWDSLPDDFGCPECGGLKSDYEVL
jgi:rubredoxin-NAD+ reductase